MTLFLFIQFLFPLHPFFYHPLALFRIQISPFCLKSLASLLPTACLKTLHPHLVASSASPQSVPIWTLPCPAWLFFLSSLPSLLSPPIFFLPCLDEPIPHSGLSILFLSCKHSLSSHFLSLVASLFTPISLSSTARHHFSQSRLALLTLALFLIHPSIFLHCLYSFLLYPVSFSPVRNSSTFSPLLTNLFSPYNYIHSLRSHSCHFLFFLATFLSILPMSLFLLLTSLPTKVD